MSTAPPAIEAFVTNGVTEAIIDLFRVVIGTRQLYSLEKLAEQSDSHCADAGATAPPLMSLAKVIVDKTGGLEN